MKKLLLVLFLTVFLLTACSGEEQIPVSETPIPETESQPTETIITEEAPSEIEPTEAVVSESGGGVSASGVQMECTLVSDQPDTPSELVAIFGVTEDDWVKGPETAAVTYVEYSDFQ